MKKKIIILTIPLLSILTSCEKLYSYKNDLNLGSFDEETMMYTEEFESGYAGYEDCKTKITVHLIGHEDELNYSNFYIDSVDFVSIDILAGWDSVKFIKVGESQYLNNNQNVYTVIYFEATKDGVTLNESEMINFQIPYDVIYNGTYFEKY